MKYERGSISNGKLIEIYDDVFTSSERYTLADIFAAGVTSWKLADSQKKVSFSSLDQKADSWTKRYNDMYLLDNEMQLVTALNDFEYIKLLDPDRVPCYVKDDEY